MMTLICERLDLKGFALVCSWICFCVLHSFCCVPQLGSFINIIIQHYCLLVVSSMPGAVSIMPVRGHLESMDAQTWLHALSYLRSTQPRAGALGLLRCQCKSMRATLQEVPSWKILNLNETCNYPDYPHVHKLLRGLVHPLVGLEPTCAPGRPNRQLLSERNRVWSQQNSPSSYDQLDIELVTLSQHPFHDFGTFFTASAALEG